MGEDRSGHPSTERVSVPQAADHLGTTVDATRKRVQRGTIPYEKDVDGRVWVLLDTGRPRQDSAGYRQDTGRPQSDTTGLISELRAHNATLQTQLEAERQAHAEARRLLLSALEKIPPAIEAPVAPEARESPETAEAPVDAREYAGTPTPQPGRVGPQPPLEAAQEAPGSPETVTVEPVEPTPSEPTEGPQEGAGRVSWWRRMFGG